MCGRTCLTLDPDQVLCACKYPKVKSEQNFKATCDDDDKKSEVTKKEKCDEPESCDDVDLITPEWRAEFNCGRIFQPSYNIAPTDITPVLVSAAHFHDGENKKDEKQKQMHTRRLVVPMMWGMIPFWHKGDYRKHGLTTNNCRLEHMLESKLYRGPFRRGQRCVVLCEGFYEWQTTKSAKPSERAAFMVHMPQANENIKLYDKSTWTTPSNVQLLKMAGLFDVWEDESGDKMYSYSIITFESSKIMSWMHHRMPAILETEQQVSDWLDFKRVSDDVALATLRPATEIKWYRVTNLVNNSRNKSEQCNKPIELAEKPKKPPMNKTMLAWLNTRKEREIKIEQETQSAHSDEEDDDAASAAIAINQNKRKSEDATAAIGNASPKRQRFRDFKQQKNSTSSSSSLSSSSSAHAIDVAADSSTQEVVKQESSDA